MQTHARKQIKHVAKYVVNLPTCLVSVAKEENFPLLLFG